MSFIIAKQPIFDKEGKIVAYEAYLRRRDNMLEYPKDVPYNRAAYIILGILIEYGIDKVGEGKRVMINVSVDSLLNKALENLPPEKLIFELIPSQMQIGPVVMNQALKSMGKFKEAGVIFAASYDLYLKGYYQPFVEECPFMTVDFPYLKDPKIPQLKLKGKKLIITKIENKDQYDEALEVGDFFEGNYLEKPYILKEFEITPYLKTTLIRLMAIIHSAQSMREIAKFISYDVGLTAKLLRFVNSAYFSPVQEVKSVEQACSMLGMKNLRNFIFLLAMNDYISAENPILWKKSLVRAFLANEMAKYIIPDLEEQAYFMGLFSLIDQILNVDKIGFLKEINIDKAVIDGFIGEHKKLKELLDFVSQLEEEYENVQSLEALENSTVIDSIEKITGIPKLYLLRMAKEAHEKAEHILSF